MVFKLEIPRRDFGHEKRIAQLKARRGGNEPEAPAFTPYEHVPPGFQVPERSPRLNTIISAEEANSIYCNLANIQPRAIADFISDHQNPNVIDAAHKKVFGDAQSTLQPSRVNANTLAIPLDTAFATAARNARVPLSKLCSASLILMPCYESETGGNVIYKRIILPQDKPVAPESLTGHSALVDYTELKRLAHLCTGAPDRTISL